MIKSKIYFVATVEFAVNAFLKNHLRLLSKSFDITVLVNTSNINFLKKQGLNIKVESINISRNINLFYDLKILFFLFFLFLFNRPAAVHSITPKAGILSMLAAFFAFIPFRVHTFTGQVWITQTGFFRYFLKKIDTLISFLSHYVIVDSHSQREFLIKNKVLLKCKSIVFGSGSVSGVDLKKFKKNKKFHFKVRSKLGIPQNAFVFLYLGRLNKDKGILDLARAFSRIKNDQTYLIIVGPDEADLSKQIKNIVNPNRNNLRLMGFSNFPQYFIAASNVLCLPSYREGFGSVIIEAGAMEVPSIASNIYGISDAVQNFKTGLLHPPKNVDSIIECMQTFLSNPTLVKRYGQAAKKRVVSDFDADLISKYWFDFYLHHVHKK